MTDRERLLALLDSFGLTPVTVERPSTYSPDPEPEGGDVMLVADQGGVKGYNGFFCTFEFEDDGRFRKVGVWE